MIPVMDEYHLEPGLLPIFRAYVFVRLAAMVFVAVIYFFWIGVPFEMALFPTAALFVGETVFLYLLLFRTWFRRHLGRYYLPLALLAASAGPILQIRYILSVYGSTRMLEFWLIFPFLTVPLILTAWQYNFGYVALYCVGTALLELAFVKLSSTTYAIHVLFDGGAIVTRSLFFLFVGYIITHLMSEQRGQRRELAEANRKLARYAVTQEQLSVSRERNRLARELHDTLAHTLSGLAVQLDALETVAQPLSPRAAHMLDHALMTTREGLNETRRALQDLRATPLEDMGLALALKSLAQNFANLWEVSLTPDIQEDIGNLAPEVEQAYYRVAQEALDNIARHAEAGAVMVSLTRVDRRLTLIVSDDGRGIAPDADFGDDHFGIQGMRERAALIGGTLEIEAHPGQGTTLRLTTET
jgi:signal transduction histidine kinase